MERSSDIKEKNALYIISTPIGNLKDITYRAIETIKNVEYLFCEDTRVTSKLLSSYNISRKLDSYHDYSDKSKEDYIINLLKEGHDVGLVSDCGTPLISDPGFEIVKRCSMEKIRVVPIPGPTAVVSALTISGLDVKPYMFYGFLDHKESKKIKELEKLKDNDFTMIFYESPLRVHETIKDMYQVFGDRDIVLVRELTKLFEEKISFKLSEYKELDPDLKGEMVLVVSGKKMNEEENNIDIILEIDKIIKDGFSLKEASKMLSNKLNKKSSDIYNEYLRMKK